jgi:fibronectin-binding autotransporter adhesin
VAQGYAGSGLSATLGPALSAGTQSVASGTVIFSNSNGISFGMAGSQTITASYTVPTIPAQFSGGNSNLGNTVGDTGVVTGRLVLVGSNNITLSGSTNGGSMTISISGGAGGGGTGSISAGTTRATLGEVVFSNSNGMSFGVDGQTVTASYTVPSTAGLLSNIRLSAGTTSNLLSALTFANGNGITFGLDASTLTASHNGLTSQSNQAASGQNGSFTFQTLSFSNANGLSFGTSAGPAVTGSYTVPVVSNAVQSVGSATGSGTNTSRFAADDHVHAGVFSVGVSTGGNTVGDTRVDVGRFVFQGGNNVTLSQITAANALNTIVISAAAGGGAAVTVSDAATSGTVGRLAFTNLNGVTLSLSTGAGGSHTIVGSHNAITSQTNQTAGIYAVGNTTGQSSSSTYDARTLSIDGAGIVSVGWSNGTLRVSATQSNQAFSAAGGSSAFQTLGFSDNAAASFTNTNGSVAVASVRASLFAVSNTTQSSSGTQNLNAISFAGAGIASVGVTNGSVVISVPAGGGGGDGGVFAGVSTFGNTAGSTGTVSTGNFVLVGSGAISLSQSTGAAGSAATVSILAPATSSLSATGGISIATNGSTISIGPVIRSGYNPFDMGAEMVAGAQGAGTLYFVPMTNAPDFQHDRVVLQLQLSNASNSSNSYTLSMSVGLYTKNASTMSLVNSTSGSFAASASGTVGSYSLWAGIRNMTIPWTSTRSASDYWLGIWSRTTTGGGAGQTLNQMLASQPNSSHSGILGAASNATDQLYLGMGRYSVSFSTAMPASVPISQIQGNSSILLRPPMFYFASGTV